MKRQPTCSLCGELLEADALYRYAWPVVVLGWAMVAPATGLLAWGVMLVVRGVVSVVPAGVGAAVVVVGLGVGGALTVRRTVWRCPGCGAVTERTSE